ncbi:hypothetical protein vseg_006950 [Gypsophila vaccaria]
MADVNACAPSSRIYCKKQGTTGHFCITARNGKLVLTRPNICDSNQLWRKENSGNSNFMIVHSATNKAVKYCGRGDQLILVNKPNCVDKSLLWADSTENHGGYRFLRTPALLDMVMDAWGGIINEGVMLSIHPQNKGGANPDNQLWKFVTA